MSYSPTVWEDGDIITKEKLNKLEEGVRDNIGAQGPRGERGERGPQGERGPKGENGAGLTGFITMVSNIDRPESANTQTIAIKVNELLGILRNRGVIS